MLRRRTAEAKRTPRTGSIGPWRFLSSVRSCQLERYPAYFFLAAQGLQGLRPFFFAEHGLQGLQPFFFAAQGLQGLLPLFLALHGLHAASWMPVSAAVLAMAVGRTLSAPTPASAAMPTAATAMMAAMPMVLAWAWVLAQGVRLVQAPGPAPWLAG